MKAECATKTVVEMTMSSLEIAEKVEKRHDNVKRSVKRLEEKGLIEVLKIEKVKIQRERRVEEIEVYQLSKRDGQVVAAQLSRKFMDEILSKIEQLSQNRKVIFHLHNQDFVLNLSYENANIQNRSH